MKTRTEYFCLRDKAKVNRGKVYKVCLLKQGKDNVKVRCSCLQEKTVVLGGRKK